MINMILKVGKDFIEKHKDKLNQYSINKKLDLKNILFRTMVMIEENQNISRKINMKNIDFMIEPVSGEIKPFDFYKVDEGYRLGRTATLKIIDKITNRLNK